MKTDAELWDMISEFDRLWQVERTKDSTIRMKEIGASMKEWLDCHRRPAKDMNEYNLGQSAGMTWSCAEALDGLL